MEGGTGLGCNGVMTCYTSGSVPSVQFRASGIREAFEGLKIWKLQKAELRSSSWPTHIVP